MMPHPLLRAIEHAHTRTPMHVNNGSSVAGNTVTLANDLHSLHRLGLTPAPHVRLCAVVTVSTARRTAAQVKNQ